MASHQGDDGDPEVLQRVQAARDAYTAGRDIVVVQGTAPKPASQRPARVWGGVPARNPGFTGREELLGAVRDALAVGERAVVQALQGMGGIGKTQIALEYVHRFGREYEVVWWVRAENPALISEQFVALAAELQCAQPDTPLDIVRRAVLNALRERERERSLVVFDNAENPQDVADWLPGGACHVLITSRAQGWEEVAVPVEVGVLARAESVAILRDRVPALPEPEAHEVAEALGDLALAIVQAAGFMASTGMPAAEYVALLAGRATEILAEGRPGSYPQPLAAVTQLAFSRLRDDDPAAAGVAALCAFLAPEPVPSQWLRRAAGEVPRQLRRQARDPVAWRKLLARLGRSDLVRVDGGDLVMHRLTQAIIRSHLPPGQAAAIRARAGAILADNEPGDPWLPENWPDWARILPHLLAVGPADDSLEGMAALAADYLWELGDARAAHDLARHLHDQWSDQLGPDHEYTLLAALTLANALRAMGRYAEAIQVDEDSLARERRLRGEDDANPLAIAGNLAAALRKLGEVQAARALDEDTLARKRRVLGDDHISTIISVGNLAEDLRQLGDVEAARDLDEEAWTRCLRVLGEDHPNTLAVADSLAVDLRELGALQAARDLGDRTVARCRQVLGEDHPNTLAAAHNLAACLRAVGEADAARALDEDTLARRRRVLGEDHPDTRESARSLAADLRALGEELPAGGRRPPALVWGHQSKRSARGESSHVRLGVGGRLHRRRGRPDRTAVRLAARR